MPAVCLLTRDTPVLISLVNSQLGTLSFRILCYRVVMTDSASTLGGYHRVRPEIDGSALNTPIVNNPIML